MKNIVVALDFSDVTGKVLEHAVAMANAFDARLHLIHTLDPGPNYALYGFSPAEFPINPLNDRLRAASDSRLHSLALCTSMPADRVVTATIHAQPVEGILRYAKDENADLIVLGAHGHGFIGSMLVGSVAQGVVRRAELPTLIIPGN